MTCSGYQGILSYLAAKGCPLTREEIEELAKDGKLPGGPGVNGAWTAQTNALDAFAENHKKSSEAPALKTRPASVPKKRKPRKTSAKTKK